MWHFKSISSFSLFKCTKLITLVSYVYVCAFKFQNFYHSFCNSKLLHLFSSNPYTFCYSTGIVTLRKPNLLVCLAILLTISNCNRIWSGCFAIDLNLKINQSILLYLYEIEILRNDSYRDRMLCRELNKLAWSIVKWLPFSALFNKKKTEEKVNNKQF